MTHIMRIDEMVKPDFIKELCKNDYIIDNIEKLKDILLGGYAIKCDNNGNYFISELPYNDFLQKRKLPYMQRGAFYPASITEKMPKYCRIYIDSTIFDETIEKLKNDGIRIKCISSNGNISYHIE